MLVTVVVSTVVWLAVTFLTTPEPDATLDAFYQRVRPGGPGWARVSARLGFGREPIPGGAMSFLNWGLAIVLVYTALFGIGKIVFGRLLDGLRAPRRRDRRVRPHHVEPEAGGEEARGHGRAEPGERPKRVASLFETDDLDPSPLAPGRALEEVERAHRGPLEEVVAVPTRLPVREPHARTSSAAGDDVRLPAADEPLEAVDVPGEHRERLRGRRRRGGTNVRWTGAPSPVTVLFV